MNKLELKKLLGNKIFTVTFIKKDGELRKLHGRLNVKKHLKDGQLSYNSDNFNYLIAYDLKKRGYRTINIDSLIEIKFNNKTITF